jgi:hypothetical protein
MPRSGSSRDAGDDEPQIYLMDGTDELWLDEEGRMFKPGDRMPRTLTNAKRASLQAAGIRFETRHPEPVAQPRERPADAEPEPEPASAEAADETPRPAAKE